MFKIIKTNIKLLLGEEKSTHLHFMMKRTIRNITITIFIIKTAYCKYLTGGGARYNQSNPHHRK